MTEFESWLSRLRVSNRYTGTFKQYVNVITIINFVCKFFNFHAKIFSQRNKANYSIDAVMLYVHMTNVGVLYDTVMV